MFGLAGSIALNNSRRGSNIKQLRKAEDRPLTDVMHVPKKIAGTAR
jgi:hypothetical protein